MSPKRRNHSHRGNCLARSSGDPAGIPVAGALNGGAGGYRWANPWVWAAAGGAAAALLFKAARAASNSDAAAGSIETLSASEMGSLGGTPPARTSVMTCDVLADSAAEKSWNWCSGKLTYLANAAKTGSHFSSTTVLRTLRPQVINSA